MARLDKDGLSNFDRDLLYGLEHGLLGDPFGQWARLACDVGLKDSKIVEEVESRAHRHRRHLALRGVPFPEVRFDQGEVVLGVDPTSNSRPLGVRLRTFAGHALVIATTGAGKTTRNYFLALQMGRLVPAVWLFDLRKREWSKLVSCFARLGKELLLVPGRALKLNPLQVPHAVDPAQWAAVCAEMLTSVLRLPHRASRMIQTVIFHLYRQFGVIDGGASYPTLWDLFQAVKTKRDANPQSRLAVLDNLEPVLLSLGPEVLGYRFGWRTHDLARYALDFELTGLTETDQNLLLNTLLLSEFTSRVAQGLSNVPLNLWVCLDEAQRLCAAAPQGEGSVITDLIGLTRGVGIGLDLSAQSTHGLAPPVLSNTNIKQIGRCGSLTDIQAIGSCMGLSSEQVRFIQQKLETGSFVTQLSDGAQRAPFLCRVPRMNLSQAGDSPDPSPNTDLGLLKTLPAASV